MSLQDDIFELQGAELVSTKVLQTALVEVNTRLPAFVCCKKAFGSESFDRHLGRDHRDLTLSKRFRQEVEAITTHFSIPKTLPDTQNPSVGQPSPLAFKGVRVQEGLFGCSACFYTVKAKRSVQSHIVGCDGARVLTSCAAQRLGVHRTLTRVVTLPTPSAGSDPIPDVFKALEQFDFRDALKDRAASPREISAWLKRTGWVGHVSQEAIPDVLAHLAVPSTSDVLHFVTGAVKKYFDQAVALINHTPDLVLRSLNTKEPIEDGVNHRPLEAHQNSEETMSKYRPTIVSLLVALLRPGSPFPFPLSGRLQAALETFLNGGPLHNVFSELWMCEQAQATRSVLGDPTMVFLMLHAHKKDGGLRSAKETSGPISHLMWAIRFACLKEIHENVASGMAALPSDALPKVEPWVRDNRYTTFASLVHLGRYAWTIIKSTPSLPNIWFTDEQNWKEMQYHGNPISHAQITEYVAAIEDDIVSRFDALVFGLDIRAEYGELKDNLANVSPDYSFFDDPRNGFKEQSNALLRAIAGMPALKKKFVLSSGRLSPVQCRMWLADLGELELRILLLADVTGGGPGRGTELVLALARNTPTQSRNISGLSGYVALIRAYNKTSAMKGADSIIPNGLSAFVSDVIIQLHVILRPFARVLAAHVMADFPEAVFNYSYLLFTGFGEAFVTKDITNVMSKFSAPILGWGLQVSSWRHIYAAIRYKHLGEAALDGEEDIDAEQSGHSRATERLVYGISADALVSVPGERILAFIRSSKRWQNLMHIVPAGVKGDFHNLRVRNYTESMGEFPSSRSSGTRIFLITVQTFQFKGMTSLAVEQLRLVENKLSALEDLLRELVAAQQRTEPLVVDTVPETPPSSQSCIPDTTAGTPIRPMIRKSPENFEDELAQPPRKKIRPAPHQYPATINVNTQPSQSIGGALKRSSPEMSTSSPPPAKRRRSSSTISSPVPRPSVHQLSLVPSDSAPYHGRRIQHGDRNESNASEPHGNTGVGPKTCTGQASQPPSRSRLSDDDILAVFRRIFKNPTAQFRPGQLEAIRVCLDHEGDAVIALPTGTGKSALFTVPSACEDEGVTVVISPSKALEKDIIRKAKELGVPVAHYDGAANPFIEHGARIILVSADKANYEQWRIALNRWLQVNQTFVRRTICDEAHFWFTEEWRGKVFKNASAMRQGPRSQLLLLSAAATPDAVRLLAERFDLRNYRVVRASAERQNLHLHLKRCSGDDEMNRAVDDALQQVKLAPLDRVIIFVVTTREGEVLAQRLGTDLYHAKAANKNRIYDEWLRGVSNILVTTTFLSAGNDYPHVRLTIHFGEPGNYILFMQQCGRAGRDGVAAWNLILFTNRVRFQPRSSDLFEVPSPVAGSRCKLDITGSHLMQKLLRPSSSVCHLALANQFTDGGAAMSCAAIGRRPQCEGCCQSANQEPPRLGVTYPTALRAPPVVTVSIAIQPPLPPPALILGQALVRRGEHPIVLVGERAFGAAYADSRQFRVSTIAAYDKEIDLFKGYLARLPHKHACGFCLFMGQQEDVAHPVAQCPYMGDHRLGMFAKYFKFLPFVGSNTPCARCYVHSIAVNALHPQWKAMTQTCSHPNFLPGLVVGIFCDDAARRRAQELLQIQSSWSRVDDFVDWLISPFPDGTWPSMELWRLWSSGNIPAASHEGVV